MTATMAREIAAQPETLARLLPGLRADAGRLAPPRARIRAGGCGDSWYAAEAAAEWFGDADYRPASAMAMTHYARLGPDDTVILLSVSGTTPPTVAAARRAAEAGARVVAVTRRPDSPLAAAAHETVRLAYEPLSRSTPHTLDYAVSLGALAAIAERSGSLAARGLDGVPEGLARCLDGLDGRVPAEAAAARRWLFLGAGPDLGTARYAAAKFHEAGGLPAQAEELENFVHGLNFTLERRDHVTVFAGDPAAEERARDLLAGLERLAGSVAVVGAAAVANADAGTGTGGLRVLPGPWSPVLRPFALAAWAQGLTLAAARERGLDFARPRAGRPRGAMHAKLQSGWMRRGA